jgi:ADP-ribosylglycohydrolase
MKAWEYQLEMRRRAKPVDFTENPRDWSASFEAFEYRKGMLALLWESEVPGSRAPEALLHAAVQAWHNRGYDVSEAERIAERGLKVCAGGDHGKLERITAELMHALENAPKDPTHPYWSYNQPETWEEIMACMPAMKESLEDHAEDVDDSDVERRILGGWTGQIVGGSYGTAMEGYTGDAIREAYGDRLNYYVAEPETYNDDITYELAFLAAADEAGPGLSSRDIANKWLELIPSGWSAEYFALENLRRGIYPPESGRFRNYYSEWIGAQMRTMVCGLVAPGDPLRAARYAYLDSVVSHEKNGVYAGIHSAVLTSLAFVVDDTRVLLKHARDYVPDGTEFALVLDDAMESVQANKDHIESYKRFEEKLKTYNWIHAYPNMVAVVHSLWYCRNDFDKALRILADCGADVDCNAGEVCCAMGAMNPDCIDPRWTEPFNNQLETYLPGFESMEITALARWTYEIYRKLQA